MAENYEFVSAADLPTTDAKEVDVLCVEGGELKRKPGASIGGGGGYVVRLPADTEMQTGDDGSITFLVTENYDNFAETLYNGGSVLIDASATALGQEMGSGFAMVTPNAWGYADGAFVAISLLVYMSQMVAMQFVFSNGTWTPPTTE